MNESGFFPPAKPFRNVISNTLLILHISILVQKKIIKWGLGPLLSNVWLLDLRTYPNIFFWNIDLV